MFKVEIGKTRKRWKIGPKFTMKKPGQRQWRRFDVFIVYFEHISHLFLVNMFATDACTSIIGNKKIAPKKKQKVKEQSIKTVSLCFLNWFQDIANVSSGKTIYLIP